MKHLDRSQWGVLVLRIALGTLFLLHGWVKLFGNNISFVQEMLGMAGWTIPVAVLTVIAIFELVAGLALVTGAFVKPASWLLALEMVIAVILFHARQGFFIVAVPNVPLAYGFEYHVALIGGLICLALAGPGAFALETRRPWTPRTGTQETQESPIAGGSLER